VSVPLAGRHAHRLQAQHRRHGTWRLYVLDLRTMREHRSPRRRRSTTRRSGSTIAHVTYWRAADLWKVRADGRGQPVKLLTAASSPAVIGR
jgi:hypothetical protein